MPACRQRMASPLRQPRQVQEKPEERVQGLRVRRRLRQTWKCSCQRRTSERLGRSKTARWRMVRARSKGARTVGGVELCVLDDSCDEWLTDVGRSAAVKKVLWIAEACPKTSNECHPVHLVEEGLSSEQTSFMPRRSGEPMRHDAGGEKHAPRNSNTCRTTTCLRLCG